MRKRVRPQAPSRAAVLASADACVLRQAQDEVQVSMVDPMRQRVCLKAALWIPAFAGIFGRWVFRVMGLMVAASFGFAHHAG